jgi:imidazole glycerol-phosphate synthase subunit HisH
MIVIVDYGRGNLFSIGQAIRHLGFEYRITADRAAIEKADRIVFPGVGAFGDAMQGLRDRGLVEPLLAAADAGIPILGICLGCQLLLSRGEEFGNHQGLALIPGNVPRLPGPCEGDPAAIRIPNVGWRSIDLRPGARVLRSVGSGQMFYFVHSYAPRPDRDADVLATISINGEDVPVVVQRENVVGVQFHPEKSGAAGLALLADFLGSDSAAKRPVEKQVQDA